jgi:hypothetical protein
MSPFKQTLAISATLLLLTACGGQKTGENPPPASPNPVTSPIEQTKSAINKAAETTKSATDTVKSTAEQASQKAQSAAEGAKSAVDKATSKAQEMMALKNSFQGMSGVLSNTLTAVQAGDFDKAKGEFTKFKGEWSQVKDNIKTKSADTYQQVDSQLTKVEKLLNQTNPDKAQLVTQLKALSKTLTESVSKL